MKYRPVYVVLGIAAVAVISIIAAVADPTGRTAVRVAIPAALVVLAGIVIYQWRWVSSQGEPRPLDALTPAVRADPGLIDDYWLTYRLLALEPLDTEGLRRAQAPMAGLMKANMKMIALVCILPLLAGVMLFTGKVPNIGEGAWIAVLPVILAPVALLWIRYMLARAGETAGAWLEPLGMRLVSLPTVSPGETRSGRAARVEGASVMNGRRHGREVHVSLGPEHLTRVGAATPAFEIHQDDGRLVADPAAPEAVNTVLAPLSASDRWKNLRTVSGGADGIVARRGVDAENGWMWDLWLCERLAAELAQAGPSPGRGGRS